MTRETRFRAWALAHDALLKAQVAVGRFRWHVGKALGRVAERRGDFGYNALALADTALGEACGIADRVLFRVGSRAVVGMSVNTDWGTA